MKPATGNRFLYVPLCVILERLAYLYKIPNLKINHEIMRILNNINCTKINACSNE